MCRLFSPMRWIGVSGKSRELSEDLRMRIVRMTTSENNQIVASAQTSQKFASAHTGRTGERFYYQKTLTTLCKLSSTATSILPSVVLKYCKSPTVQHRDLNNRWIVQQIRCHNYTCEHVLERIKKETVSLQQSLPYRKYLGYI